VVDDDRRRQDDEPETLDGEREGRIIVATLSWIAAESHARNREAWVAATRRDRRVEPRAA
jgi:hypothetical protein